MTACNAKGEAKTADTAKSTRSKYTATSQNIKEHDSNLSFRSIISQNPMLSSEEKKELINKKETEEWPEARKKLVLGNLRLVASIAKEEQFRKLFKAHISALFLFAFLFLPPYSREKYHKIYQILLTYNPKCAARLVAIYASHQTRPL